MRNTMTRGQPSKFRTQGLALQLDASYGTSLLDTQIINPNDFTGAPWDPRRVTVTADQTTDPFGGNLADKITEDNTNNTHLMVQSVANTVTSMPAKISVYAKAGTRSWIVLGDAGGGGNSGIWFDLTNGVIGTIQGAVREYSMTSVGNGWYLCSATVIIANGAWSCFMTTDDAVQVYTGDGTSFLYLYGAEQTQPKMMGWNTKNTQFSTSQATNAIRPGWRPTSPIFRSRPATTYWDWTISQALDNTTDKVVPQSSPRVLYTACRPVLSPSALTGGTLFDFLRTSPDSTNQFVRLGDNNTYLYSDGVTVNIAMAEQVATSFSQGIPCVTTHTNRGAGTVLSFRRNNVDIAVTGGNIVAETTGSGFTVGNRTPSFSQAWTGDIAEIVVLNAVPWISANYRIERGLNAKYAISKLA